MSGLDILRWTRDHPTLRHVSAIGCTADSWAVEDIDVRVLVKPFAVADLHVCVEEGHPGVAELPPQSGNLAQQLRL